MGIDLDRKFRTYEDAGMPANGEVVTAKEMTPREALDWGAAQVYRDTNGLLKWRWKADTAGVNTVTEASAVGQAFVIHEHMPTVAYAPTIGIVPGTTYSVPYSKRIGRAVATADGAGAFANVPLVAALAGFYGVVKIKSIKPNATVAAGAASLTFESPAATPALPSIEVQPGITANMRDINMQGLVVSHATLVDNQAIVVDGAGWGALTVVEIMFEYWYET